LVVPPAHVLWERGKMSVLDVGVALGELNAGCILVLLFACTRSALGEMQE